MRWQPDAVSSASAEAIEGFPYLMPSATQTRSPKRACTRCSTTTIDQESGESSGNPLEVLRTYRFDRALRGVTFGQNALVTAGVTAVLEIGDRGIAVHRRAA